MKPQPPGLTATSLGTDSIIAPLLSSTTMLNTPPLDFPNLNLVGTIKVKQANYREKGENGFPVWIYGLPENDLILTGTRGVITLK